MKESPNDKDKSIPTTLVYESEEEYDSDQSVDLLQPTQVVTVLLRLSYHSPDVWVYLCWQRD